MLLLQLAIGAIMVALTVSIHAIGFDFMIRRLNTVSSRFMVIFRGLWKNAVIIWATLAAFILITLDVWLWALLYRFIGAFDSMEPALYFSLSSFTTLGIGDVLLPENWRILSGIEAAGGFFIFGWTSAFIFEIITQIYRANHDDE
jgi:hypothetical protein